MRKAKPSTPQNTDYRVTVRLDAETYERLTEAIERGAMKNLSEALREMIRQKLWELRFSEQMMKDFRIDRVSDDELRGILKQVFGSTGTQVPDAWAWAQSRDIMAGVFSALGAVVNKAVVELNKRKRDSERAPGRDG